MDIGLFANADPAYPVGIVGRLEEAVAPDHRIIFIDANFKDLPKVDLVIVITSMVGHSQIDRLSKYLPPDVKMIRSPHQWSMLVLHCRREGLELLSSGDQEEELSELDLLRQRLDRAEREVRLLSRSNEKLREELVELKKLDRPQEHVQDFRPLDEEVVTLVPRLLKLAHDPRTRAKMNILCTAIELGLNPDLGEMINRIERS